MTRSQLKKPEGDRLSAAASEESDAGRRSGPAQPYPGRKARQGRIILNTPFRRTIFFAGVIAAVILAFAVAVSTA